MSQRTERIYDYKDRPIASVWIMADGGIQFDFDHDVSCPILNRDSSDRLVKLILDDRRERGSYGPHVGNFGGDL